MTRKFTRNVLFTTFFAMFALSIASLSVAAQSINESRPTPIRTSRLTGTVSGQKVYYYSLRARRGSVVTVNLKAAWTRGASMSLSFTGMRGSDGGIRQCCEGDSYFTIDHGSRDATEIEKSFTVKTDEPFLMAFGFNTPGLVYTITFSGLDLSGGEAGDEGDSVTVPGNSGSNWVNSGIRVRKGDVVTLNASGRVDVSAGWGVHGPEGTVNFNPGPRYPVSSRTRYGLSAKIVPNRGSITQKWSYGDTRRIVVARDGVLWLTANDDDAGNNTGEFVVDINVQRKR